jgi:hypothetical protein
VGKPKHKKTLQKEEKREKRTRLRQGDRETDTNGQRKGDCMYMVFLRKNCEDGLK